MPPITSPRRTVMHPTSSLARPIPASTTAPLGAFGTTPSSTGTSPSSLGSFNRNAPYMVALAGWPEPVFVAEARETWEKKHSRPPSPTGFREVRDGIGGFSIPSFSHQQSQVREFRDGVAAAPPPPHIPPSFHRETRDTPSSGTPPSRLPPLGAERRDGVSYDRTSPTTATHPAHPAYSATRNGATGASMSRTQSSSMAVDSAMRSGRSSPLRSSSSSPDAPSPPPHPSHFAQSHSRSSSHSANHTPGGTSGGSGSSAALQQQAQLAALANAAARQRRGPGFVDPRYAPNATIIGSRRTALRVAPAWTTSPSNAQGHTAGHGHNHTHAHAHTHGSQPYPAAGRGAGGAAGVSHPPTRGTRGAAPGHHNSHIQRSVPEVWPPPKGVPAGAQAPHLATAVYPRDPDSPWMWSVSTPSAGASPHTHPNSAPHTPRTPQSAGSVSPASIPSPKPERQVMSEKDDRELRNAADRARNGSSKHEHDDRSFSPRGDRDMEVDA